MILASPRPVAAVSELAPLLMLRTDELQLQVAQVRMGMGISLNTTQPSELQNRQRSPSGDRPPKYTRHSTSFLFSHAPHLSTSTASTMSSSSSTTTARPSFDSFDSPSEHTPSSQDLHKGQTIPVELDSAPSYDSCFTDTNLSALPEEALTAIALQRETLADLENTDFDELDELDRSDDRIDPDAIIKRRLTHNALLARQSAMTLASSVYSDFSQPPRESIYSAYDYDPLRASVQTYGSSVLTYGSRASQLLDGGEVYNNTDGSRPVAPLPWLPRPSALDRIHHCTNPGGGRARSDSTGSSTTSGTRRRPLPPLPTPISDNASSPTVTMTRDRSFSLPSRSTSSGSNYSVSSAGSARRPRPLPKTPTSAISTNLPDILESEAWDGTAPSSGPVRTNSMFLSPTSAGPLNFLPKNRRSVSARYSTIGYGHIARAGARAALLRSASGGGVESGEASLESSDTQVPKPLSFHQRAASRASVNSMRSTYLVPDVDELVRILNSMDDGSGSSNESLPTTTPLAGPWEPKFTTQNEEEEIDIGAVLARSRSVVSVASGKRRGGAAALEDLGVTKNIGLPTPAATPRSSPQRQPTTLPASKQNEEKPQSPPGLTVKVPVVEGHSPPPSSAGAFSLTNFPLPPVAPLYIPAPDALDASEMPIPSASSGVPPSPSLVDVGKSLAERATLPGMTMEDMILNPQSSPPRHISAKDAIADLKSRVSELPAFHFPPMKKSVFKNGVPLLGLPIPPRRRAATALVDAAASTSAGKRHPPAIDVRAANALPPPSSYNVSKVAGSSSAPPHGLVFDNEKPTVIYTTPAPASANAVVQVPSVAPLRIRRGSSQTQGSAQNDAMKVHVHVQFPPAATVPKSASAAQTTFGSTCSSKAPVSTRAQRCSSFCVSPGSSVSSVAPLRFHKPPTRARSSTVGAMPVISSNEIAKEKPETTTMPARRSSETDTSEDSESDHLATPTNAATQSTANVAEAIPEAGCATGISVLSVGSSLNAIQQANGGQSIDPAFADIIKSIAGGSEEEQMGSLLTIASSINTEHHASGYNAGFFVPFADTGKEDDEGFVDIDEEEEEGEEGGLERKEMVRKSVASGVNANTKERRRSKGRSLSSMKRRQSTRSAAAVRAAIRALPDPSTFPIPGSAGSVATDNSALAGGADFTGFAAVRAGPLPKLRVVTKFNKGGSVLFPGTIAPLSATSTKSTMSTYGPSGPSVSGGHSRNVSTVSVKRASTTGGSRKMNRLTLTDPRSPMADAAVAAATLVARVRQKRAAIALRTRTTGTVGSRDVRLEAMAGSGTGAGGQGPVHVLGLTRHGHARTGSGSSGTTTTLRSKLKMSGSGFFGGSSMRAIRDPQPVVVLVQDGVLRCGSRVRKPTIRRTAAKWASVVPSPGGGSGGRRL